MVRRKAYRAVEFGALSSTALDNIIQADLCTRNIVPARACDGSLTRLAVTVVAIEVGKAAVRARCSALEAWARAGLAVGAPGQAAATALVIRRHAAISGRSGRGSREELRREHLEGLIEAGLARGEGLARGRIEVIDVLRYPANEDGHVVLEVFVSRDKGVAVAVLEAHTVALTVVDAVEVLNGRNDRFRGVVRPDVHPHRQARARVRPLQQQLEADMLRLRIDGLRRQWPPAAHGNVDGRVSLIH